MAHFTMTLAEVMGNPMTLKEAYQLPELAGLDKYPIFDENHRFVLNQKIIDHFWMREIGWETIELFQLGMRRKLNEVMPFYNQLYLSTLSEIDPFLTMSIENSSDSSNESNDSSSSETKQEAKSDSSSTSASESLARAVSSDFPQTQLSGNGDYATAANDTSSKGSTQGTGKEASSGTSSDSMTGEGISLSKSCSITKGFQGSQSELLNLYRSTFLNIDLEVIGELETQFMLIWSNNDSFTGRNFGFNGRFPY